MVDALQADNASFFVHIDKKSDLAPFKEAIGPRANVKFVRPIKVTWMGFSQVASTLDVMREAADEKCDYYSLLSGADYPIKSNRYIFDFFAQAKTEYIHFSKLDDRPPWMHKIRHYYPIDLVPIRDYHSSARRYFWNYFYKYRDLFPARRFLEGVTPYCGCGWWSLSRDCMSYVIDRADKDASLTRFYRYTHCPIEMFFQTVILNSKWASKVQNYEAYRRWSDGTSREVKEREGEILPEESFNLRHIDWSNERIEGLGSPATLGSRDFQALKNSNCLFARKFDEHASRDILDLIDGHRAGQS